jgi:hypothetical protein
LSGFKNRVAFRAGLIIDDKINEPEKIIPTWNMANAVLSVSIL